MGGWGLGIGCFAELEELGREEEIRHELHELDELGMDAYGIEPIVSIDFLSSLPVHGILGALARSIVALRPP